MLAVTFHRIGHGCPWVGKKSDLPQAVEMARAKMAEGYDVGAVIQHLTAYGFAFFTAQAAVREAQPCAR